MEAVLQSNMEAVINHHLSAFGDANLDEILKDYTEESQLFTPEGAMQGRAAIRGFFASVFKIIPKGSSFEIKQKFVSDEIAYIAWSCESEFVNIPLGTDSFIITDNKISIQTLAAHIISK